MTSISTQGSTSITLQFDLDRNIDGAARDVQAAIVAARSILPTGLPSNPTYRKMNPADSPIMVMALTSDTLSVDQIYDAADSGTGAKAGWSLAASGKYPLAAAPTGSARHGDPIDYPGHGDQQ